jgi:TolB protein
MRVLFVRLGTGDARDLYVLDLSTGEEQQILTPPGDVIEPVYSFDNARIAFTLFTGDHDTIYVMNADSTNARRLTGSDFDEKDPAWAPDGNWIAFSSNREPENHDIYVMLADGSGEPVRLTQTAGFDGEPAWSPDGQAIAFQSFRPTADSQNEFNLWLLKPAEGEGGDGFRQLTTTAGNEFDPEWSPDGSNLAYTGQRGQVFGVYVVSAAGGEPTNLTQETARNVRPSWCICLQPPE